MSLVPPKIKTLEIQELTFNISYKTGLLCKFKGVPQVKNVDCNLNFYPQSNVTVAT